MFEELFICMIRNVISRMDILSHTHTDVPAFKPTGDNIGETLRLWYSSTCLSRFEKVFGNI